MIFGDSVRSSDLETGLSSSEKIVAQEMDTVSSLILTFQAWKEKCGYLRKDHGKMRVRIVKKYPFPPLALIRFPEVDERACTFHLRRHVSMNHTSSVGYIFPSTRSIEKFSFV